MRIAKTLFSVALLALAMTSSASAATTFGSPLDVAPDAQGVDMIMVQTHNSDGSVFAGAPAGGVLTSMKLRVAGAVGVVQAVFVRPVSPLAGSMDLLKIGGDVAVPVTDTSDHEVAVPLRVPVLAGDRIALAMPGAMKASAPHSDPGGGAPADFCAFTMNLSAWALGGTKNFDTILCNRWIPAVQATLEADADADGYGDETQDACPTDATTQGACPAAKLANLVLVRLASKAKPRSSARRSFRITNTGSAVATIVPFSVKSSKKVRELKIVKGCTPGSNRRSCTIPAIAPGASATITVSLKRKRATRTVLSARSGTLRTTTTVKFSKPKK